MSHAKSLKKYQKTYLLIFVSLLFLTFLTVFVARFDFSIPLGILLATAVATLKGGLVAYFFMHISQEKTFIPWTLFLTFFFLFILISLIFLSHSSRLENYYVP